MKVPNYNNLTESGNQMFYAIGLLYIKPTLITTFLLLPHRQRKKYFSFWCNKLWFHILSCQEIASRGFDGYTVGQNVGSIVGGFERIVEQKTDLQDHRRRWFRCRENLFDLQIL